MDSEIINRAILPENYRFLQQHVYSNVGIVLEDDKHYLFESRLAPIVKQLGLQSTNDLCALLQSRISMRLSEPSSCRTERRSPQHQDLRFWSAAASTGQEAYSLAMLLLGEQLTTWNIQILGTDYSSKVVERARSGLFQQIEVNRGLPGQRFW